MYFPELLIAILGYAENETQVRVCWHDIVCCFALKYSRMKRNSVTAYDNYI